MAALATSGMSAGPAGGVVGASPSSGGSSSSAAPSPGSGGAGFGGGGGAAGEGGGSGNEDVDACETVNVGRRTRHCLMRVLGIMMEDGVRPLVMEGRLSMSRAELDGGETGANREVWKITTKRYRDPNHTVSRISDDAFVASCDPNIISQPDATEEVLCTMWRDIKARWNPQHGFFKSESGNNASWENFCKNDRDIFLMGIAIEKYPELLAVMLPEGTEREDDGFRDGGETGGEMEAIPDASPRTSAKRKGEELRTNAPQQSKKLNQWKRTADAQARTGEAVTNAVSKITPALQEIVRMISSASLEAEKARCLSLKLKASSDLTESYLKTRELPSDERSKGGDADEWLARHWSKRIQVIKMRMEKDADDEL